MIQPLEEKRARILKAQAASDKAEEKRAAEAKVAKYSTPGGGARLGGAGDEAASRKAQAATQRRSLHKLRRPDAPQAPALAGAALGGAAPASRDALRAARLAALEPPAARLPSITGGRGAPAAVFAPPPA